MPMWAKVLGVGRSHAMAVNAEQELVCFSVANGGFKELRAGDFVEFTPSPFISKRPGEISNRYKKEVKWYGIHVVIIGHATAPGSDNALEESWANLDR